MQILISTLTDGLYSGVNNFCKPRTSDWNWFIKLSSILHCLQGSKRETKCGYVCDLQSLQSVNFYSMQSSSLPNNPISGTLGWDTISRITVGEKIKRVFKEWQSLIRSRQIRSIKSYDRRFLDLKMQEKIKHLTDTYNLLIQIVQTCIIAIINESHVWSRSSLDQGAVQQTLS